MKRFVRLLKRGSEIRRIPCFSPSPTSPCECRFHCEFETAKSFALTTDCLIFSERHVEEKQRVASKCKSKKSIHK